MHDGGMINTHKAHAACSLFDDYFLPMVSLWLPIELFSLYQKTRMDLAKCSRIWTVQSPKPTWPSSGEHEHLEVPAEQFW